MSEIMTRPRETLGRAPTRTRSREAALAGFEARPLLRETIKLDHGQIVERTIHAHPSAPVAALLREPMAANDTDGVANVPRAPLADIDREETRRRAAQAMFTGDPDNITATDLDQNALREAATELGDGARTPSYNIDPEYVWRMLGDALATEVVCALRYKRHHYTAHGLNSPSIAQEFAEHARQELDHADKLARRIVQLGGKPDFDPNTLTARSHAQYDGAESLQEMLISNLAAERVAIEAYRQMIAIVGQSDPTTRRLLEDILAEEEDHANDLRDLIQKA